VTLALSAEAVDEFTVAGTCAGFAGAAACGGMGAGAGDVTGGASTGTFTTGAGVFTAGATAADAGRGTGVGNRVGEAVAEGALGAGEAAGGGAGNSRSPPGAALGAAPGSGAGGGESAACKDNAIVVATVTTASANPIFLRKLSATGRPSRRCRFFLAAYAQPGEGQLDIYHRAEVMLVEIGRESLSKRSYSILWI